MGIGLKTVCIVGGIDMFQQVIWEMGERGEGRMYASAEVLFPSASQQHSCCCCCVMVGCLETPLQAGCLECRT